MAWGHIGDRQSEPGKLKAKKPGAMPGFLLALARAISDHIASYPAAAGSHSVDAGSGCNTSTVVVLWVEINLELTVVLVAGSGFAMF